MDLTFRMGAKVGNCLICRNQISFRVNKVAEDSSNAHVGPRSKLENSAATGTVRGEPGGGTMTLEDILKIAGPELYVLFQAVVALTLGGLVGWEREAAGKWAGLRTHMMVCLAAMLFVKIGYFLMLDARVDSGEAHSSLQTDPLRIIEAIVTGVAFLGAGTIFRDRDAHRARGLTTAASLLTIAPIGIAVALDRYILAVGVTLIALFVLNVMRRFEGSLLHPSEQELPPQT
jgi:putative Mg2+ transporter-C (MgtC) family protein